MNALHRRRTVTLVTLASLTALTSLGAHEARAAWTAQPPLPSARAQASIAVDTQGRIHVLGGYVGPTSSTATNAHDIFAGDAGWTTGLSLPGPVRAAAGVGIGDKIYLLGGYNNNQIAGGYATAADGGWAPLPAPTYTIGWEPAADVGADGKIYVFGGEGNEVVDGGASLGSTNGKTQIFDPTTSTWSLGADMPGRRMQHRALRGSDGKIYVIGGQSNPTSQPQSSVFVYNPTTNTWAAGPPINVPAADGGLDAGDAGPTAMSSFAAAATPDRAFFVLAGGSTTVGNQSPPYFDSVFLFDVAKQTWSRYALPLPIARRELVAAFVGCSLSVIGGSTGTTSVLHDGNATLPVGPDADGDGQADACDVDDDNDGTPDTADCKPQDPKVHPGATETCNGVDDNCSGAADEGLDCAEAGVSDGGAPGSDSGTIGSLDSGSGSDGGDLDGSDGGDSSSCSCDVVGVSGSTGLEAIGLGVIALGLARVRHRRSRR